MSVVNMPLTGPPPTEVPLTESPLIRVIAQVRFPLIASIEKQEFIAPFQEAIRKQYPVLRPELSHLITLEGQINARVSTIWSFQDVSGHWRATLAPDFLALETKKYTSREDFFERFKRLLDALQEHLEPPVVDRLGVRYINQIQGDNVSHIEQLVRPEVAGVLGTPLRDHVEHSITESLLKLPDEDAKATARWGLLPPGATVDPRVMKPVDQLSWLLDVDVFQMDTRALEVDELIASSTGFAERIYSIFRWAVTDELLKQCGGEV